MRSWRHDQLRNKTWLGAAIFDQPNDGPNQCVFALNHGRNLQLTAARRQEFRYMTEADIDRSLMASIQAGDQSALATLYDKYVSRLLRVAYDVLRNTADAEDLLHDVFLEAWRRAKSYDPKRGTVYSWLVIRVRSRAIDRIRALRVAKKHAMLEPRPEPLSQRDDSALASDGGRARDALAKLSDAQREVLEMGYFQGLTCSEIASRAQIPLGTVKSRLSSAIARLRDHLVPQVESR